jgi:hypothetical protein
MGSVKWQASSLKGLPASGRTNVFARIGSDARCISRSFLSKKEFGLSHAGSTGFRDNTDSTV